MKIYFYPNGTVSAFDENKQPFYDMPNNWMNVYFELLESKGIDPVKVHFEAVLNKGEWRRISPYKTNTGEWNYNIHNEL